MKMTTNSKKGDYRKILSETPGRFGTSTKQKIPWTQPLRSTGSPDNASKSLLRKLVPSKVSIGKRERVKSPKNYMYRTKRKSPISQQQTKDQIIQMNHIRAKDSSPKNGSHQRENSKSVSNHVHEVKREPSSSPIIIDPKLIKNVLESKVNYGAQKSSNNLGENNKDIDGLSKLMISPQPLNLESVTQSSNPELGVTKPMGCMYEITVEERGGKKAVDGDNSCGTITTTMPGNVILLSSPEDADPGSGTVRYIPAAILLMDPREYSEGLISEDGTPLGLQAAMALQSEQNRVFSDMINNDTKSLDPNTPSKRHINNTGSRENSSPLITQRSKEDTGSTQPKKNGECLASERRPSKENQNSKGRNNEATASTGNIKLERTHNDDSSTQKSEGATFHNILSEISDCCKSYVENQSTGPSQSYRRQNSQQITKGNYTENVSVKIIEQSKTERNYGQFCFENRETNNSFIHVFRKERTSETELKSSNNDQCFSNATKEIQRENNYFMKTRNTDEGDLNMGATLSMNPQSEDFETEVSTSNVSSGRFQPPSDCETEDQNSSAANSVNQEDIKTPFEIHLPVKNDIKNSEKSERFPVTYHFERMPTLHSREYNQEQKCDKQHSNLNRQVYAPNTPSYGTASEDWKKNKPPLHCNYVNNNMEESSRERDMPIPVYHMANVYQKQSHSKTVTDSSHTKNSHKTQKSTHQKLNTASPDNVTKKPPGERMEQLHEKQIEREKKLSSRPGYEGCPPISCPDARCGVLLSSLTLLPHFNKEHSQVPFVLIHAARNVSISVNLADMQPYSPKIFVFFHVIEKMRYEPPIDTVEDLALRDMPWAANHEAWVFSIKEATEPDLQRIVNNFHVLSDDDLAIRATHGDLAIGVERLNGGNFALGSYLGEDAVATLRLMSEDLYWGSVAMIARKGSPFMPSLNAMLGRLVDSGIPLHLEGEVVRQFLSQRLQLGVQVSAVTENTGPTLLSMSHVQGSFTLLVLGLAAGLGSFIAEISYHTVCQARRSK